MPDPQAKRSRTWQPTLVYGLLASLILVSALQTAHLIADAKDRTQLAYDRAEIDDVRHGLLNAEKWLDIAVDLALQRLEVFQITDEHSEILQPLVNDTVDVSMKAFLEYFRKKRRKTYWFIDLILDLEKLHRALVPVLGPKLVELGADWFNDPSNRQNILGVADQQFKALVQDLKPDYDRQGLDEIQSRYECPTMSLCRPNIRSQLVNAEQSMTGRLNMIIICSLTILFIVTVFMRTQLGLVFVLATCLILWVGGIAAPMLDVEARLLEIGFSIGDYRAVFQDQVLFFHSKSVADFVRVMVETAQFDMIVVGILIAAFSVVFPICKIAAALDYQWRGPRTRRFSLINFFALNSSKWSMADVLVVAIFMAYLGLGRLITTQLNQLGHDPKVHIISAEGTGLLPGFYLFLGFCLCSLWYSTLLGRLRAPTSGPTQAE